MALLYRSQQLNRYSSSYGRLSEAERKQQLDEQCIKKYGHPFLKPYEQGDEHRFFLPERAFGEFIVYHRYKHYSGQKTCHAHHCYCYQGGNICKTCAPLNTTSFYDLAVPIDGERFGHMQNILRDDCGMSTIQIYNWLAYWIHDIIPKRYSCDSSTPIFYRLYRRYITIKISTPYSFMSFLYEFVSNKHFKKQYKEFRYDTKPSLVNVSDNSVKIRTVKALFKWSIDIYSHNRYIVRCETCLKKGHCGSMFWSSSDIIYDRFSQQWKNRFEACLSQIQNEVAYRPGKIGMMCARDDFERQFLLLSDQK